MDERSAEIRLSDVLTPAAVVPGFQVASLGAATDRLLGPLLEREGLAGEQLEAALEAVRARPTVAGRVGLPHARLPQLRRIVAALGLNAGGVVTGEPDGLALVLVFASPEEAPAEHLRFLAQVARVLRAEGVLEALLEAPTTEAVLELLRAHER